MEEGKTIASDVAFTDTVKAIQRRKGSRPAYARMEAGASWAQTITPELKAKIEAQTSVFLATVNRDGQPYIQHRGGPAGFLRVLDDRTIGFADFAGNRQYITRLEAADVQAAIDSRDRRILSLEAELTRLRANMPAMRR